MAGDVLTTRAVLDPAEESAERSRRPIRVVAALPYLAGGGVERAVLALAGAFDRSKVSLSLLVHQRWGDLVDAVPADVPVRFVVTGRYSRRHLPAAAWAMLRAVRDADVVVGACEGRATALALWSARLRRKPSIAMVHFHWGEYSADVPWRTRWSLRGLRHADRVVACSAGAAESIRRIAGLDPSRTVVIPNGIPLSAIRRLSEEPLPESAGGLFRVPTIVTVGRLSPEKGQADLIRAHAALVRRGVAHDLVIVGQGGELENLRAESNRLGVAASVRFVGYQRNPYPFMKQAAAVALTSRSEGFALVLAEAMACGTPVVAVDCPSGPSEILDHGRFGILVRLNDPDALVGDLARVIKDPEERRRLSQLSMERSAAFDIAETARSWEGVITSVWTAHQGRQN